VGGIKIFLYRYLIFKISVDRETHTVLKILVIQIYLHIIKPLNLSEQEKNNAYRNDLH
jgi:hypothetical protein